MRTHNIKIIHRFASAVQNGKKTFEYRYNDRDYRVDDIVKFSVVNDEGEPVKHKLDGREFVITYIIGTETFEKPKLNEWVAFSIKPRYSTVDEEITQLTDVYESLASPEKTSEYIDRAADLVDEAITNLIYEKETRGKSSYIYRFEKTKEELKQMKEEANGEG